MPEKCEHPPTKADVFPAVAFRVDRESDGNTFAFARGYVDTGGRICYHGLTAKRNKNTKARIIFVRSATLVANTLRKPKPLCLCTYTLYVSLTFIVFCKTTSRNLHNWHFKSQERRTRHSARIEPKRNT